MNNKQKRAAKARRRAKEQAGRAGGRPPGCGGGGSAFGFDPTFGFDPPAAFNESEEVAFALVGALAEGSATAAAQVTAARLLEGGGPRRRRLVAAEMDRLLTLLLDAVTTHGWTPSDLGEIVTRRAAAGHLPGLAAALTSQAARHPASGVAPAWWEQLAGLGPAAAPNLGEPAGLAGALTLARVLNVLPAIAEVLPAPGRGRPESHLMSAAGMSEIDTKQLARVRALLAKAESTTYDAEAEALTAKAQELITRFALQRLLDRAEEGSWPAPVTARRLWLEAPYVMAKANLVDAVASANRCRAVISEALGFSTVIGEPRDLDTVEILSTSLLVQANAAMLRHGRQSDRTGASRTRSFRQSFLVSYAARIGERLRGAESDAVRDTGRADRLLPVLRAAEEAVQDEFERLFPMTSLKPARVTDRRGWAAGRAAADLALLDVCGQVAGG